VRKKGVRREIVFGEAQKKKVAGKTQDTATHFPNQAEITT